MYNIIDTMMSLSKPLQAEFSAKVQRLEEDKKMTLISPTIQLAREEGELIGELKGEQKVIIRLLNQRFGEIEPPIIEKIRKLSVEQLEELTDVLLTFSTVANLEQWLENRANSVNFESY